MNFIQYTMNCAGFKIGKLKTPKGDATTIIKMTDEEKAEFAEKVLAKRKDAFKPSSSVIKFVE